jgi:hypothetical protein
VYGAKGSVNPPPVLTLPVTVSQAFLVTPHPAVALPRISGPVGPVLKFIDPFDSTSPWTVTTPSPWNVTPEPQPLPSATMGGGLGFLVPVAITVSCLDGKPSILAKKSGKVACTFTCTWLVVVAGVVIVYAAPYLPAMSLTSLLITVEDLLAIRSFIPTATAESATAYIIRDRV